MRKALDLLASFVGSGHVDTRKIIDLYQRTGRYIIPLHEFLRAIIYGDYEYYDPNSSPVANLFDISSNGGREHFLTPIILNFLDRSAQHGGVEFGFVTLTSVYEFCQAAGFTVDEIDFSITRCVTSGLIESTVGSASNRTVGTDRLRITQNGAYALKRLLCSFVYYDAIVVDTPIVSDSWRPRISEARMISERLDRAGYFASYLEEQFAPLAGLETGFDFATQLAALRGDIAEVRLRVGRAERRRHPGSAD